MTNPTYRDHDAAISPDIPAPTPIGGRRRRPVKIVELPVVRAARARLDARSAAIRLPVVSLNGPRPFTTCPSLTSSCEAA